MSGLVGPDGKTPVQSDMPERRYRAGGLEIKTPGTTSLLLQRAMEGAQQMIGQQVYAAALQRSGSAAVAQQEAQTAVTSIRDPFQLEPCALAVFMYLAREIEHRDRVLSEMNEKLKALGAEPVDLKTNFDGDQAVSAPPESADEMKN